MLRIKNLGSLSFLSFFALTLAACSSSSTSSDTSTTVVTDTLGWKFDVNCSSGLCALTPTAHQPSSPRRARPAAVVETFHPGSGSLARDLRCDRSRPSGQMCSSAAPNPLSPVACVTDADCLAVPARSHARRRPMRARTTCAFCADASSKCASNGQNGNPLTYDVLTLCQADIPWPSLCPYIASQPYASRIAEVATLCGSKATCATVPADCRQLTPAPAADGGAQSSSIDSSVDSGL
jgi:hypothetical protein